jgi:glutathione peroxidase
MHPIYDVPVETLSGEPSTLAEHRGEVLLIVNTASQCGFTPQLEGLQSLHESLAPKGLKILGFPCNQFRKQEPGSATEIAEFCTRNYGVSFPLYSKVEVNGPQAHPLFKHLRQQAPGLLGTSAIKWNFTKFLVKRDGTVLARFGSATKPESSKLLAAIGRALAEPAA